MAFYQTEEGGRVYFEHHRGAGMPVVLIHGWAMSSRVWVDTIEALKAAGHAVIAIDHRGCGQSDRDFADLSVSAIAGDIVAIVRAQVPGRKVVLNGWSLGGAIAAQAAQKLGHDLAGLVLTCAASPRFTRTEDFPYGGERADLLSMPAAISANRATFFRNLAQGVCARDVGQPMIDWMWSIFMDSGPDAVKSLIDIADLDQRALLAALSVPVLSIVGGRDAILQPEVGEQAALCAAKGEILRLEDCGHAPFIEDAPEYMAALLGFLNR